MKRNILIFLAAFAALLTVSCEKPEPEKKPASLLKSPARITVSVDDALTKTALGSDGLSILWEGTESLGVFDGIATAPNKFDAASAGATTSFTGEVSDGAENFIVFYPYQAEAVVSDASTSTIKVRMPAVQQAVKDGFDPAAGLAARLVTSLDEPVKLYNQFALLKVNVDQDGVTAITVSATNRKLAGGIALKVSTNGGSNGDAPTSNSVTLKNADDSALEQGFYYIAVRPSSTTSPYEGFAMEVVKNGVSKTRTASNNLVVARNHILSIGKVSTLFDEGGEPVEPVTGSRYEAYMAWQDITIGGITINRSTLGDATLLTASSAATPIAKNAFSNGGVYFLDASEEDASFLNSNDNALKEDTYLISNTEEKVTFCISKALKMQGGSLLFKDLIIDQTSYSGVNGVSNSGATSNAEYLVFDGCEIKGLQKIFFSSASGVNFGVENFIAVNSKFAVGAKVALFSVNSSVTDAADYKNVVFRNNVVYSYTARTNWQTPVYAFNNTTPDQPNDQMKIIAENNIFYNVASSGGLFKSYKLGEVIASKNLLWITDGQIAGGDAKLFGCSSKTPPTVSSGVTDNIAYGQPMKDASNNSKWSVAESKVKGDMQDLTVLDEDPLESFDVATGSYVLKSSYASYGPAL